jgi:1-aminocyclopropane-1-carboxylate deaminase
MFDVKKSILQSVNFDELRERSVSLFIKRDDLIDSHVSGNKWRKLKFNIESAKQFNKDGIVTFGGAFSNHLVATAAACYKSGIQSVGIIRGEELNYKSNDTLIQCSMFGMQLEFVSRAEYAMRNEKYYHESLLLKYPGFSIVPEGGANYLGIIGCQEIMCEIDQHFDHVFVAQGTTCTSVGIALSLPQNTILHVVPVLKGFDSISEMKKLLIYSGFDEQLSEGLLEHIQVHSDAHFGGYGKYSDVLLDFMKDFFHQTAVPLDPIYSGKALFELLDWVVKNNITNTTVLFIHTGGIQGGKQISETEKRKFS